MLWAAPLEDELSLVAEGTLPLPLDVPALDEDGSGEEELPDGAVLDVVPFDDDPFPYDVVPAPLPPDVLAVADDDEPPDAVVLWDAPFDEVLSDEVVGAAALLPDVPLGDEGDAPEVEPEPDLVEPDDVEGDDALCDGLSCGEEAAVDDGPDEVGDGE